MIRMRPKHGHSYQLKDLWKQLDTGTPSSEWWKQQAACKDLSPAEADRLFYPNSQTPQETFILCGGCPVRGQCAAAGESEVHGTWAGQTAVMRGHGREHGRRYKTA